MSTRWRSTGDASKARKARRPGGIRSPPSRPERSPADAARPQCNLTGNRRVRERVRQLPQAHSRHARRHRRSGRRSRPALGRSRLPHRHRLALAREGRRIGRGREQATHRARSGPNGAWHGQPDRGRRGRPRRVDGAVRFPASDPGSGAGRSPGQDSHRLHGPSRTAEGRAGATPGRGLRGGHRAADGGTRTCGWCPPSRTSAPRTCGRTTPWTAMCW